ncbi:unnamed protein product [Tilletia caries]|nr:unnamed protein product [Tilletia caries]
MSHFVPPCFLFLSPGRNSPYAVRTSFYHRLRHRSIPLRQTTTIHRRIRRQRTKVSQSTNNSPTSLKAPCPSARAGGTKTPTPIPSALRSFLRAQAEANRSTTVESGGPGSNSNSNDSSGNTTSMSARSFFTEFGARGHRSDGSYGTTTTIRSDTGSAAGSGPGLRGSGGLIFDCSVRTGAMRIGRCAIGSSFDMAAKRLGTDGLVIEREMVDRVSSKVFYLISR